MLYKLKLGEISTVIPTIGYNVETVQHKNVNITVWDVGGRDKLRPLSRNYYQGIDPVIFMVRPVAVRRRGADAASIA